MEKNRLQACKGITWPILRLDLGQVWMRRLSKTDGVGAKSLFEEAKQIGRRLFSGDKPKPKPKAKPATQYIVKDGDYLWRVAAAQLGDSTRYKEIVKLNPGVLKNENSTLKIGMHLNLPTQ